MSATSCSGRPCGWWRRRYVFATSFGNQTTPYHIGIMSTARLQLPKRQTAPQQDAMITARRLYKLMLKSVARVAGYTEPEGCVLAFPRSLEELDLKPAEFCPPDRAVLVAAGILKETPDKGCSVEIAAAGHAMSVALTADATSGARR